MLLLVLTIIYLSICISKMKDIPESISETSYIWTGKVNWFSLYCFSIALLLLIPWTIISKDEYRFICFIAIIGITACGATPLFKEKFQGIIHYTGGIMLIICWIIWMLIEQYYALFALDILLITSAIFIKRKSWVFWWETIPLISLIIMLIYLSYPSWALMIF